jgi:hypothetical protein
MNEEFHELPENLPTWCKTLSSGMKQQCCAQVLLEIQERVVCREPHVFHHLNNEEREREEKESDEVVAGTSLFGGGRQENI